jgi:hypothetical protein
MDSNLFKKITYGIVLVGLLGVIYFAFFKDDSTSKNADFLGLKNTSENKDISNQQDLNIDGSEEDNKSDENNESNGSEQAADKRAGFYTVKEGDTYGCIAESYYGSYEHWTDVLNTNIRYGNGYSEHELHVGAVLEMPEISKDNLKPASKLCS